MLIIYAGVIVLTTFVSPFRADRKRVHELVDEGERQVEQFNTIYSGDLVVMKKREEFGKTMKLYGHGRVKSSIRIRMVPCNGLVIPR